MKLTPRMCLEVLSHEAIVRQAYYDSVGVLTWSGGLTAATGHDVSRYIRNPQTMQKCIDVYIWALDKYADHVREVFAGHDMTEEQFTGALSFCWNLGEGNLKKATWVKRWKAGDIVGAREAFMWFNKPASIIGRRKKECALFFDGTWSGDGKTTEFTKVTKKLTPNWRSAKRVDVSAEVSKALSGKPSVSVDNEPFLPEQQTPTLSPVAVPKPKPIALDGQTLTTGGGLLTGVLTAIGGLDVYLAVAVVVCLTSVGGLYLYMRMKEKAEEGM